MLKRSDATPAGGVIEKLGLTSVSPLSVRPTRQVWHVRAGKNAYVLKCWPETAGKPLPYQVVAHRMLAEMPRDHVRLVVPEFIDDGHDAEAGWYVVLSFLDGKDFGDRWHYAKPTLCGGIALSEKHVDMAVELLVDLSRVPALSLVGKGLRRTEKHKAAALAQRRLRALKALPAHMVEIADDVLVRWSAISNDADRLTISNVDFRHLNFIEMTPLRTGVIDWDDAQASCFEIEQCVSYLWLFLWNRPDLQARLIGAAKAEFGLKDDYLRMVMLYRTVLQMHTCSAFPERLAIHTRQACQLLEETGSE